MEIDLNFDTPIKNFGNILNVLRVSDSSKNVFSINLTTVPTINSYGSGEAGVFLENIAVFDTNEPTVTKINNNTGG